jgi:hypothetical protein
LIASINKHIPSKMKQSIVFILLSLGCQAVFAQQRSLNDEIDTLAAIIKDTYVGYKYKVKGNEFDELVRRVKQSHRKDTFARLSLLTTFFKDLHLGLYDTNIEQQAIDTQQCKKDSQMVQRYLASKKRKGPYEGYWLNERNRCVIALIKVASNPVTYHGYVMESRAKAIPGYCLLKMVRQKDGKYFTDCITANLGSRLFAYTKFKNKNTLWTNAIASKWLRQPNYQPGLLDGRTIFSYDPAFEALDDKTVLIKMPSFVLSNKPIYDSIIKANDSLIRNATTLIVDIRNNGGGRIKNYFELLPYIYTQTIVHCAVYIKYSRLYANTFEVDAQKYRQQGDTANARLYQEWADTVNANLGKEEYYEPDTLAQNLPVLPNPKNVALITNNNCMSAAELIVLNFRQSSKVTVFGETTGGVVDYLVTVDSLPVAAGKYRIYIPISKRILTEKEPSYDGVGIKPDVEIGDDVADWVAFVRKYYARKQ